LCKNEHRRTFSGTHRHGQAWHRSSGGGGCHCGRGRGRRRSDGQCYNVERAAERRARALVYDIRSAGLPVLYLLQARFCMFIVASTIARPLPSSHCARSRTAMHAASVAAPSASSAELQPASAAAPDSTSVDVVVIGAGLSGLVVARTLCSAGVSSVALLEARPRVGGRLLSHTSEQGGLVDLGATWRWPNEPRVSALASSLKLDCFPHFEAGDSLLDEPAGAFPAVPQSDTNAELTFCCRRAAASRAKPAWFARQVRRRHGVASHVGCQPAAGVRVAPVGRCHFCHRVG
jgi:hypothetical protein